MLNFGLRVWRSIPSGIRMYVPVLFLFFVSLIIALCTYTQYGMSCDEQSQRAVGILCYDYIFHGSDALFREVSNVHGTAFELFLAIIEKTLGLTVPSEIYHMRHLVSHIVFLLGVLSLSMLSVRMTNNRFLPLLCFLMMVCMPRIYAHSFFNSKDVPFLAFMAMAMSMSERAFRRDRTLFFMVAGLLAGYATGIRIMGVFMFCLINFFLLLDILLGLKDRKLVVNCLRNMVVFSTAFCFTLYIAWPLLWHTPVSKFIASFQVMVNYNPNSTMLFSGQLIHSAHLPWTYFPLWFSITVPPVWLFCGYAGILLFLFRFLKTPLRFLRNTPDRNFLLFLGCFLGPVLSVILLHSAIYDDWRHLYFVYPAFVMMGIYFLNKVYHGWPMMFVRLISAMQIVTITSFIFSNINFSQVYFNRFVSHDKEFLRNNYELDYWGAGFKEALEWLAANKTDSVMTITGGAFDLLLENNKLMLPEQDAKRFKVIDDKENPEYFITNFRLHKEEFPFPYVEYSVQVQNSTVLKIYRTR